MSCRRACVSAVLSAMLIGPGACTGKGKGADTGPREPAPPGIQVRDVGFENPGAVLYDADTDAYLVSNINGSIFDADGNGFISRLAPDGKVLELKWIDGARPDVTLNAPKGMTLTEDRLYVTDINVVRSFDRTTGEPAEEFAFEDATFLNDVQEWESSVFVTDMAIKYSSIRLLPTGTDAIYEIDQGGHVRRVAAGPDLGQPSGLTADSDGLWIATFGSNELFLFADGVKQRAHRLPSNELDGVVLLPEGVFLVSSWRARAVYQGPPFEPILSNVDLPGGLDIDPQRRYLLIALRRENIVWLFPLPDLT